MKLFKKYILIINILLTLCAILLIPANSLSLTEKYEDGNSYASYLGIETTKARVYDALANSGFGDVQIAAIMGNMEVESGFIANARSRYGKFEYYGLCQWNIEYSPEVNNSDIWYQCFTIKQTIKKQFNSHPGPVSYNDFMTTNSVRDAALWFAKYYERCNSGSYVARMDEAERYYNECQKFKYN